MKVFILCPYAMTGGPEASHQFCEELNVNGVESYIYYYDVRQGVPQLYPEYKNIRLSYGIEDSPENYVVVPEIIDFSKIPLKHSNICVWWLAYANLEFFKNSNVIHLFQSYFSYAAVRPHIGRKSMFFISDYVNSEPYESTDRVNIICYNGRKDTVTPIICERLGITPVRIDEMSKAQVVDVLRNCKIYMDLGFHPGKDRVPREAAINGCVVVTNKCNSAAYYEDIPIAEKVKDDDDCVQLIKNILDNYDEYYNKQKNYRQIVQSQKDIFKTEVKLFIEFMKTRKD